MKNKKLLFSVLLCCIVIFCCAACSANDNTADTETGYTAYLHEYSGLNLTIPSDWEKKKENKDSAVFVSADGKLSFGILFEIGGFAYYSQSEMAKQIGKIITGIDDDYKCEIMEELNFSNVIGNHAIKIVAKGIDGNDTNFMIDFVETTPFPGIRYYMFTVADVETYEANFDVIDKVYSSFKVEKTDAEIYKLLEDKK